MINIDNYKETVKDIDFKSLPISFWKGHQYMEKTTENYNNWDAYHESDTIKKVIDTYFAKLDEHLSKHPVTSAKNDTEIKTDRKEESPEVLVHRPSKKIIPVEVEPINVEEEDLDFVERIPDEIRFMRRYLALHNKKKTKDDLLRFINALHRAIIEKKIRKTSPFAKQMTYIQSMLVKRYNEMTKAMTFELADKTINEFKALIASEKVLPSVMLIKRYISLNGKYDVKDKARLLMEAMTKGFAKGKITKSDKYYKVFDKMHESLKHYVKSKTQKILSIQETELNGLNGVLAGCGCQTVHGIDDTNDLNGIESEQTEAKVIPLNPGVMSSMDFKNMRFKTLGFVGKYRKLIGDPSEGFSAMVYGKPKMGKSFLCVDFAGYLAHNHGKVLYIAKEEGLDMTLQEKLKAKDVAHPNLYVTEEIPADLTPYDFIFFDSVNKLGLSATDLETLKHNYPGKSFIYIFQTTKEGNFRGANEFQHDVDIVIEVPEKGLAVQNGRFNQGGDMRIFEEEYRPAA